MTNVTCKRCDYSWLPRIEPSKIKCCAHCKSRLWDVPRPSPRTESPEEENRRELEKTSEAHKKGYIKCNETNCPYCNPSEGRS